MDQQARDEAEVVQDGDDQILIFPDGYFDLGEEIDFRREGDLVVISRIGLPPATKAEAPNDARAEVLDRGSSLEARATVLRPSRAAARPPQDEER